MQWIVKLLQRRRRRDQALEQIMQAHKQPDRKNGRGVNVDYGVEMEPVARAGESARWRTATEDGDARPRSKSDGQRGFLTGTSILANKHMPEEIEEDAGHWYSDSELVRELPEDAYSVALMSRVHRKRVAFVALFAFMIAFSGLLLVQKHTKHARACTHRGHDRARYGLRECSVTLCSQSWTNFGTVLFCRYRSPCQCDSASFLRLH